MFMQRNQKGFLIVLCLCVLSISGIFGLAQYRKGLAENSKQEAPEEIAQEKSEDIQKESVNSGDTVAQSAKEEEAQIAKAETEEEVQGIGKATLANDDQLDYEYPEEYAEMPVDKKSEASLQDELLEAGTEEVQANTLSFASGETLSWPVKGDVILAYSMDKSIYFSTLNQYKYHPAVVIGAEVGSEVTCAADGVVTDISVNEETGTTVTMDLGDGYEAVYGQLKEVDIHPDDLVPAGKVIGYVSEPTKYYSLEGSNLYFQLLKDGEPRNPMDYLQ